MHKYNHLRKSMQYLGTTYLLILYANLWITTWAQATSPC
jgi:hypothetical protein